MAAPGLSPGAAFLHEAVFGKLASIQDARRFFGVLRGWAETGKAYRGRTFSKEEVEEVIAEVNRRASSLDGWWPRWAMDREAGVEVLVPAAPTRPGGWTRVTPVGIGYCGQKSKYLFVRAANFEMDVKRSSVRQAEGGKTAQECFEALAKGGKSPVGHPDWTDGTDLQAADDAPFIAPGVATSPEKAPGSATSPAKSPAKGKADDDLEEEYERMALLHRSHMVRIRTCDHPDPLTEPRVTAGIRLRPLDESDVLMLPSSVVSQRLSSLQVETVALAARRFRQTLPDGRTMGFLLGDGTGCGKGRCIAAIVQHMWNSGCKRAVWVSATNELYHDAVRDLKDLGADIPCVPLRKLPPSGALDKAGSEANQELVRHLGVEGDGVIFLTYSLLVRTGERRQLVAAPVRTAALRMQLLGLVDNQMRCLETVEQFGDSGGTVVLKKGDRLVGVESLRQLQGMQPPFTVTFERVFDPKAGKGQGKGKGQAEDDNGALNPRNSRLGQLVAWLGGAEAKGVICYDEVHKAKNLVPDKNETASTKTGLFVDILQRSCPKAPVLYVSATAATEIKHLGYMSRLGLWGQGTAFEDFTDFARAMEAGGVSAMEMLAINMKALGSLSCKQLAYVGTEFETRQVGLTQKQRCTYDEACGWWMRVLKTYEKFTHSKELTATYEKKYFRPNKGDVERQEENNKRLWQFFWGAQQRFFKAMCNSMKIVPAAELAKQAVEAGEQVVISIWATGEARTRAAMAEMKENTKGRVTIISAKLTGLMEVSVTTPEQLAVLVETMSATLTLKEPVIVGKQRVQKRSLLLSAGDRRLRKHEDVKLLATPVMLLFRAPGSYAYEVKATLSDTNEKVTFELQDDSLGERVVIGKVTEGPASFRCAGTEQWRVKSLGSRPVGKVNVRVLGARLRSGMALAFHDPLIEQQLSGPQMIAEQFVTSAFLTADANGRPIEWAVQAKEEILQEMNDLNLPPNAMDEIIELLGGSRKVAEMSGRSHRMKRRKDGKLAYVARSEELCCSPFNVNLVDMQAFQMGAKKICLVTEVASAGISLHSDRRCLRKGFTPPRRTMISVELPWGADKAIQCFGRVHRANQLQPPKFMLLVTPLGGETRFTSAIARRMKLLGAVTKGDRMTCMGGGADRDMAKFDVNNSYGARALATLYTDTSKRDPVAPDLLSIYETLPFLGEKDDIAATGRWPTWRDFAEEVRTVWASIHLVEEMESVREKLKWAMKEVVKVDKESDGLTRFLNRILMLDIELQNGLFDAFFAVYMELVRIDVANDCYDEGVVNLNRCHGQKVECVTIEEDATVCKDPKSGAETRHVRLCLDRGIPWAKAREMLDAMGGEGLEGGFYAFRQAPEKPPQYLLLKERQQVGGAGSSGTSWLTRRRQRQFTVWRPDFGEGGGPTGTLVLTENQVADDERLQRLGDSAEELQEVEEGWSRRFEETLEERLVRVNVLVGDVLGVWRLARSGKVGNYCKKGQTVRDEDREKLQIVRAVAQPGDVPVVGLQVREADIPRLRYMLEQQHQAAQEAAKVEDMQKKQSLREMILDASEAIMEKVLEAEDRKLECGSWLDMHKMLAEGGRAVRSVEGMVSVQKAMFSLVPTTLRFSEGHLMAKPDQDMPSKSAMEAKMFPEEFEDYDPDAIYSSEDEHAWSEPDLDGAEEATRGKKHKLGKAALRAAKRRKHEAEGLGESEKKEKKSKKEKEKKEKKSKKDKKSKKEKKGKKEKKEKAASSGRAAARRGECALLLTGIESKRMAEELFGAGSGSSDASGDEGGAAPASVKGKSAKRGKGLAELAASAGRPPATPFGAAATSAAAQCPKGHTLQQLDAYSRGSCDKCSKIIEPGAPIRECKACPEVWWLCGACHLEEAAASMSVARPTKPEEPAAADVAPAAPGQVWTYELVGNRVAIRQAPDVKSEPLGGYLEEGQLFNVVERLPGPEGDPRTYLKLMEGGWVYDRSSKDTEKVIVKEA